VFAHGGNLKPADLGKDPKLEHQRKALRNNASKVIKKRAELNRITYDNKLLLNRILEVPSVINFKDEHYINTNRRHKQLREETTYYRQKHSPFPISAAKDSARAASACSTPLRSRTPSMRPESAPPMTMTTTVTESPETYLERLRAEHLTTVLNMKRPPELVKAVFSAMMILVSPFEPSHFDVSWFAVQQWIQELGSVQTFLDNLRAFERSMVPEENIERTIAFMQQSGLQREKLKPLSDSLADLCDWIWATCAADESAVREHHESLSPTKSPASPSATP
jgi:hypothetical protein